MRLNAERRRMTTFETRMDGYTEIPFALKIEETELTDTLIQCRLFRAVRQTESAVVMRFYPFRRWD